MHWTTTSPPGATRIRRSGSATMLCAEDGDSRFVAAADRAGRHEDVEAHRADAAVGERIDLAPGPALAAGGDLDERSGDPDPASPDEVRGAGIVRLRHADRA